MREAWVFPDLSYSEDKGLCFKFLKTWLFPGLVVTLGKPLPESLPWSGEPPISENCLTDLGLSLIVWKVPVGETPWASLALARFIVQKFYKSSGPKEQTGHSSSRGYLLFPTVQWVFVLL